MFAGALTLAACRFSVGFQSIGRTNIPGIGEISFGVQIGGGWGDFRNDTGECAEVVFKDGHGNPLGTAKVHPGLNTGVAPPGSEGADVVSTSCDGDQDLVDGTGGKRHLGWNRMNPYSVFGGPIEFEEDSQNGNAFYSFVVRAHTVQEAESITATTLAQPIGAPIDPRVTVVNYFKAALDPTSASVFAIAREPFVEFEMDVNGITNYATLDNGAVQSQIAPDLWVVEAPVAYTDINGLDLWNDVVFRTKHSGDSRSIQSSYAMLHRSN